MGRRTEVRPPVHKRIIRIAQRRPITKWNVLALVSGLAGAAVTLTLAQLWLNAWMHSGKAFPIGQHAVIDLPEGRSLVYYESPVSVPVGDVTLRLLDSDGERVPMAKPDKDISYSLMLTGWSGRALWRLTVPQAGRYSFTCSNHNFAYDEEIPADDRVVFLRRPDSLAEVQLVQIFIEVTGATITIMLVMFFYIMHGLALRRHRMAQASALLSQG